MPIEEMAPAILKLDQIFSADILKFFKSFFHKIPQWYFTTELGVPQFPVYEN